ncbi:hypothetical protein V1264_012053 [Littorina saxatilis]|uniref:Uncharacterized protein n=1 Tax=Littorina saxatilis TaxID=31220 RepID=A0AAN9GL65_9CAEN
MSAMMMTLGSWLCLLGGTTPSWLVSDTTGVVDKVVQGWVGLLEYCVVSKLTFTRTCWNHDNWEVCLGCVLFCCLPGLICVLCLLCCCDPPMKFLGKISLLAGGNFLLFSLFFSPRLGHAKEMLV